MTARAVLDIAAPACALVAAACAIRSLILHRRGARIDTFEIASYALFSMAFAAANIRL